MFKNELDKISNLKHPNVLQTYAIFEDTRYVHILNEECRGGSLMDHILSLEYLTET